MEISEIDLFSPRFQEDPYPAYAQLRQQAPVYCESRYGVCALTRFADVEVTLCHYETLRSDAGPAPMPMPTGGPGMLPLLAATDPPHHDQLGGLVNRAFTPRRVDASEARIRSFASRLVADLPDGDFDLVPGPDLNAVARRSFEVLTCSP